jgi:hypothetical protein
MFSFDARHSVYAVAAASTPPWGIAYTQRHIVKRSFLAYPLRPWRQIAAATNMTALQRFGDDLRAVGAFPVRRKFRLLLFFHLPRKNPSPRFPLFFPLLRKNPSSRLEIPPFLW